MKLPEKQTHYQTAFEQGLELLRQRDVESFEKLGAVRVGDDRYELAVLNGVFVVDLREGWIRGRGEGDSSSPEQIKQEWQILVLHYLGARSPRGESEKWIGYSDISEARGYESVYRGRVLGRLCHTVGRQKETFVRACSLLGAEHVDMGDEAFRFQLFPLISIIIVWYAGDEDLPPGVSILYPENIQECFSVEDIVVLSEGLVGKLQETLR